MRPALLNPLFASVRALEGVGPRVEELLARLLLGGNSFAPPRVIDLLWHLPSGLIDRRARPMIAQAEPGRLVTLSAKVKKHRAPGRGSRAPHTVTCEDETGEIDLLFFRAERSYIERLLPVGETRIISGRVERYGERLQMAHPDYILAGGELAALPVLEPVYPLTLGLAQKLLRKIIGQAVERAPGIDEWQDARLLAAQGWPSFKEALRILHQPQSEEDIGKAALARSRLAYDELLASQFALALLRRQFRRAGGRSIVAAGLLGQKIRAALPFQLTPSQEAALAGIAADMAAPRRMLRLLQGDVGSGKTIVALLAIARAIEAGSQTALMAPTDILARQHFETIAPLGEAAGFRLALLTGREQGRARRAILDALGSGETQIIVGTHALFQPDVVFVDLALAVIDEQHRFGVHQRLALQAKGEDGADILVMTATPIPRTLLLTHYGDMDVSRLTEKPGGRKPVLTRALPMERLEDVITAVGRAKAKGAQIYWVCPLVESSAKTDISAAEERAAHLKQYFGDAVGLVHGRVKGEEKDAVIRAFAARELSILVATTVIEVGIHVPDATVMVIEHAERFGLAQLHQLRGRVGRGGAQSTCMLLYQGPLTETARARLEILRQTEDGFRIAEEDLRLRGGGEILGTRQSGDPGFRVAKLPQDEDLLKMAADQTKFLLAKDPNLESSQGSAVKLCLYLFGRDEAIKLLGAG